MKKLIILFCLILPAKLFAQTTFQKKYSNQYSSSNAQSILITQSGNYLVVGFNQNNFGAVSIGMVMLLDPIGNTIWAKEYSGINYIYSIKSTLDGGYILSGSADSMNNGLMDMCLLKIDSSGNPEWSRNYKTSLYDYGSSAMQLNDGNYILIGRAFDFWGDSSLCCIIKVDSLGNIIWQKLLPSKFTWGDGDLVQIQNGNIVITSSLKFTQTFEILRLIIDPNGNTLSSITYDGNHTGGQTFQTSDGGYVTSGFAFDNGDMLLFKTDSIGNVLWSKTYGPIVGKGDMYPTTDGGFIMAGTLESSDDSASILIVKTDESGDTLWTKIYSEPDSFIYRGAVANTIRQTSDGGYIIVGNLDKYDNRITQMFIIKTDAQGNSDCNIVSRHIQIDTTIIINGPGALEVSGIFSYSKTVITNIMSNIDSVFCLHDNIEETELKNPFEIYPIPTSSRINIKEHVLTLDPIGVEITDVMGNYITSASFSTDQTLEIDLLSYPPGIYFVTIICNKYLYSNKIIKVL